MPAFDLARWKTLEPFVDDALSLTGAAREQWLDALRVSNSGIAAELDALFAGATSLSRNDVLDRAQVDALLLSLQADRRGEVVGAWTLDRSIGAGGMGTVWLAHRSDGRFDGVAAVKLLNVTVTTPESLRRFRQEGTVLARLSHPNIAKLLDAGVSTNGQPYLVLEYVDGERIDTVCDSRGADAATRIALMITVLGALADAHGKLIVHRDLKPHNILVTKEGIPKLLDFGIAKLLEDETADEMTTPGARAMTVAWAAPEQVLGEAITTATDVYAAGALLYRLLSGHHPTAHGASTQAEFLHGARKGETLALSAAVTSTRFRSQQEVTATAAALGSTPAALSRQYRGDLDTILARSLQREPAERYASAAAMAEDLQRSLDHRPIRARPDSLGYRVGRFVRRNRAGVALGIVALSAVVGSAVVAVAAAGDATRQRDIAVLQATNARATSNFQRFLMSQVGTEPITLRQMLVRGERMLSQYDAPPSVTAELLSLIQGRYYELDDSASVARVLRRVDSIARASRDPAILADAAYSRAFAQTRFGRVETADSLAREGRRWYTKVRDPAPSLTATALLVEGDIASVLHHSDSAVYLLRKAARTLEMAGEARTMQYISTLAGLASVEHERADYRSASISYGRLRPLYARSGQDSTISAIIAQHNEAFALQLLGEIATSDSLLQDDIRRIGNVDRSGELPRPLVITSANGAILMHRFDDGIALWRRLLPNASPFVVQRAWTGITRSQALAGRPREAALAMKEFQRASAKLPKPNTRDSLVLEGLLKLTSRNPLGALADFDTLVARRLPMGESTDIDTVLVRLWRAEAAVAAGNGARGLTLAREAQVTAARDSISLQRSGYYGRALLLESAALELTGDRASARRRAELAMASLTIGFGATHPLVRSAQARLTTLQTP